MNRLAILIAAFLCITSFVMKERSDRNSLYTIVIGGELHCVNCTDQLLDALQGEKAVQQACIATDNCIYDSLNYYNLKEMRPHVQTTILPRSPYQKLTQTIDHWPVLIKSEQGADGQTTTQLYTYEALFTRKGVVRKQVLKKIRL